MAPRLFIPVLFAIGPALLGRAAEPSVPAPEKVWAPPAGVEAQWQSDAAQQLTGHLRNRGPATAAVELPAGLVATGPSGAKLLTLRSMHVEIPPGQLVEALLPSISLDPRLPAPTEPAALLAEAPPAPLRPLLDYSARNNDLPRPTAQLTAQLLLVNPDFGAWRTALGHPPEPQEVATAIDALTIARQLDPARSFALAENGELRLLALRLPLVRAKAMQLFGMTAPEGVPVPEINQLLHTAPGDNCPICRMRAKMDQAGNGL